MRLLPLWFTFSPSLSLIITTELSVFLLLKQFPNISHNSYETENDFTLTIPLKRKPNFRFSCLKEKFVIFFDSNKSFSQTLIIRYNYCFLEI